jgi:hypothetical protein
MDDEYHAEELKKGHTCALKISAQQSGGKRFGQPKSST